MVKESWFRSLWRSSRRNLTETDKSVVGVLTFEVASLMSKVVHIWNCLRDEQVVRMREEIINSVGIRKLVSDDDEYLVRLICAETMENLGFVTRSVAMLGKRCTDPVLQRLENVFDDLVRNYSDFFGWEFSVRKMEKKVKKMEKFVGASGGLYHEMEVLADLEQVLKKIQASADSYSNSNPANSGTRSEIQKKVVWQRQEVKHLRDISLWNKSFDYVVWLLVHSIFTIFKRISVVFALHEEDNSQFQTSMTTDSLPRSHSVSASSQSSSVHPSESSLPMFASGPLRRPVARSGPLGRQGTKSGPINGIHEMSYNMPGNINAKPPRLKSSKLGSSGPLKGCIMGGGGTRSPVINGYPKSYGGYSGVIRRAAKDSYPESVVQKSLRSNLISLSSKCTQLIAPSSTLGGAALALHYANVIIVIEKLVHSPHLIGPDARDDLYSMLPQNIRAMLRERLMLYVKTESSFYDPDLATEWSGALTRILEWLAPLAHNMIRWQSERNFQQQHLISRTNVLLVQTLYFANQAKTEGAVTELLVGLNYLWRFGRELNEKALMECASSGEFDDYLDYN